MPVLFRNLALCAGGWILISSAARGAEPVDYNSQIKPLLREKCYSCHGALKQEAALRLETRSLLLDGGDSGAAIAPGDPASSLLIERVTADEDLRMPPAEEGARLKPAEVALLRAWIEQGAVAPDEPPPPAPSEHWAFRPVRRPDLPEITGDVMHPVDRLLEAQRHERELKTQSPAERSLLIRRLYLDLIGLPPTLEQLHDDRPWDQIVDELLASPQYGERWGRHWMDIWRYSDWYGLGKQLRYSQKHMWRWRDWIVGSLNDDKGYDRMILEMLAGDELAPGDPEAVAGTGFLARNYYLFNRTTWLDSTIEHTGKALLGLTLNCAKCHDHKYDPITQVDYYNFRAIFEPHQVRLDPVPGVTDFDRDGLPRAYDDNPDAPTYLHVRGDPKNVDEDTAIVPQVPALFASFQPEITPVELPPVSFAPGTREYVQQDHLAAARASVTQAEQNLTAARKALADAPTASDESPPTLEEFTFNDEFDAPDPEAWEIVGSGWEYRDGALHQTQASREPAYVQLRGALPRDFEATCRYTTTGGTTYKSVTFRFDTTADAKYDNYVYTSAHAPGPKVQVAYSRDGSSTYPREGRTGRPIEVGQTYELRFAVRDRLVNVWLDGEFVVAYELPDRRPEGAFRLSAFDATAAFDSLTLRSLPADVELTAAKNAAPSVNTLEVAVEIAKARLVAARAEAAAVEAVVAADDARYGESASDVVDELARTAAIRQAQAMVATAEAELAAVGRDEKKRKAAEEQLDAARKRLAESEAGNGTYTTLRASRKALETPEHKEPDYPPTYSPVSTGRRLSLARWMTARNNPLTARVAVNHVWMRHFGEPLVESVFDFGLQADEPQHAELLDWLAADFMESGWSFKRLHRLIVTSQAYRLSSSSLDADRHTLESDPDNRFYWRMNTRRMESQIVRDSLLQLAGTLDPTLGGPSVDVGSEGRRRSIYFTHSAETQDKFLTMFDDADLLQCYRRQQSIVPQQALALANSQLSMTMSGEIAERLFEEHPSSDESAFVARAFETILGRGAASDEQQACLEFCEQLRAILEQDESVAADARDARIRTRLVHSLINHNDFVSIR